MDLVVLSDASIIDVEEEDLMDEILCIHTTKYSAALKVASVNPIRTESGEDGKGGDDDFDFR